MWPSQIRENAKQREVARMLICQGAVTKGIPCLLCHISLTINGVPSINNVQVDWIPMVFSRQHLKTQKWICQALIILLHIKAKEGTPNLINMSWKSRGLLMRILTCKLYLKFRTMARNIKKTFNSRSIKYLRIIQKDYSPIWNPLSLRSLRGLSWTSSVPFKEKLCNWRSIRTFLATLIPLKTSFQSERGINRNICQLVSYPYMPLVKVIPARRLCLFYQKSKWNNGRTLCAKAADTPIKWSGRVITRYFIQYNIGERKLSVVMKEALLRKILRKIRKAKGRSINTLAIRVREAEEIIIYWIRFFKEKNSL